MSGTRTVFYGFGSWVGQFITVTQCGWWSMDPTTLVPQYDSSKLITTDIGQNPQAYRNGSIPLTSVQADDAPTDGGLTKVGPAFPGGATVNGLWLEQGVYNGLPAGIKPARIPTGMQCNDYELTTVVYWTGPMANRRYWGLYAEIIAENGTSAQCKLWAAGTGLVPGQGPQVTAWLDLSSTSVAHPIETGFTGIGTGVANPKNGPLFLEAAWMARLRMNNPKLPPLHGSGFYPPMPPRR